MPAMTALWVTRTVGVANCAVHAIERLEHAHARLAVERAGGFVAQQQGRLLHDGARDGDALLLAAGKLRGKAVTQIADADQGQRLLRGQRPLGADRAQRHVLAGRQAGDEVVGLKDEADVTAPVEGQRPLVERRQIGFAEQEAAAGRTIKAADKIEERGLAAAGRTEQDDEVAPRQVEIDAAQGVDGTAGGVVGLDQIPGGQHDERPYGRIGQAARRRRSHQAPERDGDEPEDVGERHGHEAVDAARLAARAQVTLQHDDLHDRIGHDRAARSRPACRCRSIRGSSATAVTAATAVVAWASLTATRGPSRTAIVPLPTARSAA